MGVRSIRRTILYTICLAAVSFLTACAGDFDITPGSGRSSHAYPVDTVFKEFYQTLGGSEVLGPAISALEIRDTIQCQFTERALMCFNPAVVDASRFTLYPLGLELDLTEPAQGADPGSPEARVVDGYVIYEKFLPLYDKLYGARYVGRPLTQLRVNQDLRRVEQFFENVGFYQQLDNPNGPVYLIPYGAYLCGGDCSYKLEEYWSIVKSNTAEQPFSPSIARLGGPAVFGSLLLKPQLAEVGMLEQVYTNVIFYAPQEDLSQVRLRPLPLILGYETHAPVAMIVHDQLVFYEVENGLGHNVPRPFDAFIAMHGGMDLAGPPVSEVVLLPDQKTYRQCFTNYCLLYDPTAAEGLKVRMASLGEEYLQRNPAPEEAKVRNVFSADQIALLVAADKPNLSSSEEQVIRMMVRQAESGEPIALVEGTLLVNYPGRPATRYNFAPSDANGMAAVVLPAQTELANGSRVSFQVCLNLPSEQPICTADSYLIWNTQ